MRRAVVFADWEVLAAKAGQKTQLLRPIPWHWWRCLNPEDSDDIETAIPQCPFGPVGGTVAVLEPIYLDNMDHLGRLTREPPNWKGHVWYRADGPLYCAKLVPGPVVDVIHEAVRWRSPGSMPRWAVRLRPKITKVEIVNLHEITEADAHAEGVEVLDGMLPEKELCMRAKEMGMPAEDARVWLMEAWHQFFSRRHAVPKWADADEIWCWKVGLSWG